LLFLPRSAWTIILLFYISYHSWVDRCTPLPQLFPVETEISQTFLPKLAHAILSISSSQVARIKELLIGLSLQMRTVRVKGI
jgi:hypothetical protein